MSNLPHLISSIAICCSVITSIGVVDSCNGQELRRFEASQVAMGIQAKIVAYAPDKTTAERAIDAAFERIHALNRVLSDYDEESEVSRLHRVIDDGKFHRVSEDLSTVIDRSLSISRQSSGAFDATLGRVVALWRESKETRQLPKQTALEDALAKSGYQLIELDEKNLQVRAKKAGLRLDFGGIGKGFAADQALAVLARHGITIAMVDMGGDLVVGDPPPGKDHWHVAISPLSKKQNPKSYVQIKNCGIATSGDLFQFVEIDGKRFSHIINPQTGLGLTDRTRVTVIAENATDADAWASAMSVLAPSDSLELAESISGVNVLIARDVDGSVVQECSVDFPERISIGN